MSTSTELAKNVRALYRGFDDLADEIESDNPDLIEIRKTVLWNKMAPDSVPGGMWVAAANRVFDAVLVWIDGGTPDMEGMYDAANWAAIQLWLEQRSVDAVRNDRSVRLFNDDGPQTGPGCQALDCTQYNAIINSGLDDKDGKIAALGWAHLMSVCAREVGCPNPEWALIHGTLQDEAVTEQNCTVRLAETRSRGRVVRVQNTIGFGVGTVLMVIGASFVSDGRLNTGWAAVAALAGATMAAVVWGSLRPAQ